MALDELSEQEICQNLEKLYNESESRVKTNAIIRRAYIDRTSSDTINQKVNAQMNAIKIGIYDINPKFKEGSKNYDSTKELVTQTLADYEKALIELSEFYDGKIEQLILRKVELEASLVGSILNEEYLYQKVVKKKEQKENDGVKKSVKDNIKSVLDKFVNRKQSNKEIDPRVLENLVDGQDVAIEIEQKLEGRIEKSVTDKKINKEFIEKTEKEISLIDSEIAKLNERKIKSIFDAMEVGDNQLTTSIKKPRVFKKITRFFVSRFNTAKVVQSSIIEPLNLRIESFKNNELLDMKG